MANENGTEHARGQEKETAVYVQSLLSNINQPQCLESNLANLQSDKVGSTDGLLKLLNTNPEKGIDSITVGSRRELYGSNYLPSAPRKTFLELFIGSFDDETVRILMAAAIVSLAIGVYEDPSTGYVEGVAILTAVFIVAMVTAMNDYQKETQFRALSKVNDNIEIIVIRDGKAQTIFSDDLVVGDVVCVEAGHAIPCDGVLIKADGLEIDESALTGEPLDVYKTVASDPFVLSGCITTAGSGTFVAIAVGASSQWGVIKAKLDKEQSETPLQEKLDTMANMIGTVGMAAAAATFVVMMIMKIVVQPDYLKDVGLFSHALSAFIIGVTIVVVAVPEGLPLAVTISLAYSTKKMLADNNLIRHLSACETMGNATNICSDKTGTLTENRMTVVKGLFANVSYEDVHKIDTAAQISNGAKEVILQCIGLCSTAHLTESNSQNGDNTRKHTTVIGNKTEGALLNLVISEFLGKDDYELRRSRAQFGKPGGSRLFPFSSLRKCMSVIYKLHEGPNPSNNHTLYHKGAAEKVLGACNRYLDSDGSIKEITDSKRVELEQLISSYASQALRCIALSHRDNISTIANLDSITVDSCADLLEKNMIFDALIGIIDPLRSDVVAAVKICQKAGIFVRMVTGDNLETAKAIAKQAGILTNDGIAMVGEEFRKLTPAQLDAILPKLQVLARSSPEDKHVLVERLNGSLMPKSEEEWLKVHPGRNFAKEKDFLLPGYYDEWAVSRNGVGEVVGVTGDGTNDGPALKAADVGLSMGLSGTDVAKNASDIIIMDDNFSSIVKAVLWGRAVFDNIRKFLQFQLTVNVVALTVTFFSAVAGYKPPLNAVMMLWVNLIMDTMGALALGTEAPNDVLLDRPPYKRDASLISLPMWRNIIVQASYQLAILGFLLRYGSELFGCVDGSTQHFTIIFNAFVYCQIFNEFNAREIGDDFHPFRNLGQNPMFIGVIFFTVTAQLIIVQYGGDFTQTSPLNIRTQLITILLGAVSIPLGFVMRLIPVEESARSFAGKITVTKKKSREISITWGLVVPVLIAGITLKFLDYFD